MPADTARLATGVGEMATLGFHGFFWQAPELTNAAILDWVAAHS